MGHSIRALAATATTVASGGYLSDDITLTDVATGVGPTVEAAVTVGPTPPKGSSAEGSLDTQTVCWLCVGYRRSFWPVGAGTRNSEYGTVRMVLRQRRTRTTTYPFGKVPA